MGKIDSLRIAYDRQKSTEMNPVYWVYDADDPDGVVWFTGSYTQCLVIIGAYSINPDVTMKEIRNKTNGFV
jgi:hypothetical protein